MFEGVHTALITPFKNGKIDYDALAAIIEFQISGGVDGIVPLGTTGESPTVGFDEHEEFISKVVGLVKKRVKVIAGTGANSTEEAVHLSRSAEKAGVDAVLQVNPYYNRPPQRGLVEHFAAVADSITIPVILYNHPGRTGINFLPESVKELADRCKNVAAMKEASGDLNQIMRLHELCGERIEILSGDDSLLLPVLSVGGKGIISVLSNILPSDFKNVISLYNAGRTDNAKDLFYKLLPLCRAMNLETNPVPVKAAMEMMGFCSPEIRLPLVSLSDNNRKLLRKALEDYGVKLK